MGCGASKPSNTVTPAEMAEVPKGKKVSPDPETRAEVKNADKQQIDKNTPLPSIQKNGEFHGCLTR